MKNKSTKIQSARLSRQLIFECIQIIIHVYLFLDEKLCKFNILHNPSSS